MYMLLTQPVEYEFEIKFLIVIKLSLSSIHSQSHLLLTNGVNFQDGWHEQSVGLKQNSI